jgi:light-regulated signal transduction histidine kinase (bacteriophytochrome)
MNRDFDFLQVNKAYSEADGRDPSFFEGKNHFALYPDAENEAIFRHVVTSGEPYFVAARPFTYPEHPELGTTYWDWSLQPVRDGQEQVEGLLLTLVDVTARRRAEEAVESQAQELARSNEELERFAYVASHDLRAPLRAIDNLANWLTEDEGESLSEQGRTYLQKLQGRVRRMEAMVEDLLEYSRAGRVRHEPVEVDTQALVQNIVEDLSPPLGFTVTADESLPRFTAERVPLETVLRNLIGNAIKHHEQPSEGMVTVRAVQRGRWIEFVVADNGQGIEGQYQERIFHLFQTLKPRDEVEGSGMGLAVVKKIVESRGGRVWVESAAGEGAAFYFTWPQSPG